MGRRMLDSRVRFPYAAVLVLVGVSFAAIAARDSVPLLICCALVAGACLTVILRYFAERSG